jgi:hypothetical protein
MRSQTSKISRDNLVRLKHQFITEFECTLLNFGVRFVLDACKVWTRVVMHAVARPYTNRDRAVWA